MKVADIGYFWESFHGVFRISGFGVAADYELRPHDAIGEFLYWYGLKRVEPTTVPLFIQLAKSARGILDIGSNTGLYALLALAANPEVKVLAWEPVPSIAEKLRINIKLNGFQNRCEAFEVAVGSSGGEADFYISDNTTMASFHESFATFRGYSAIKTRVRQERLDSVLPSDFPVDLVKVDVEGHEFQVLTGATSMLQRWRPKIIFECLAAPDRTESLLRDLGYSIYSLSDQGPIEIRNISGSWSQDHNYLAAF